MAHPDLAVAVGRRPHRGVREGSLPVAPIHALPQRDADRLSVGGLRRLDPGAGGVDGSPCARSSPSPGSRLWSTRPAIPPGRPGRRDPRSAHPRHARGRGPTGRSPIPTGFAQRRGLPVRLAAGIAAGCSPSSPPVATTATATAPSSRSAAAGTSSRRRAPADAGPARRTGLRSAAALGAPIARRAACASSPALGCAPRAPWRGRS